MHTFEYYLKQTVDTYPTRTAVVWEGKEMAYAELWEQILLCRDEMWSQGFLRGNVKVFRATQSLDFLVTYSAIHLADGIAVPLEANTSEARFRQIEKELNLTDIPIGTADILYTTGTTGQSKGVMLSHEAIVANAENLIEAQGYSAELTFVISGPLNHIGNLSKVWSVLLSGGTLDITDGMKDMNAFLAAFDYPDTRFASFLVPASIRMLMAFAINQLPYEEMLPDLPFGSYTLRVTPIKADGDTQWYENEITVPFEYTQETLKNGGVIELTVEFDNTGEIMP